MAPNIFPDSIKTKQLALGASLLGKVSQGLVYGWPRENIVAKLRNAATIGGVVSTHGEATGSSPGCFVSPIDNASYTNAEG